MKAFLIFYSLIATLLLGIVLAKSDFLQKVGYRFGIITPWPHYHKMMTYHRWMDPVIPEGSIVFIGDSLTQALPVSAVVPNGINFGIGGDTTVGVLQRIPEYKSLERAGAIVLWIGINDLMWRSNDAVLASYIEILNQLPDGVDTFVVTLAPVRTGRGGIALNAANERILEINGHIAERVDQRPRSRLIDLNMALRDTEGQLKKAYDSGDGLHLSPAGYQVVIDLFKRQLTSSPQRL